MSAEQLVQLLLLIVLCIERLIKNSKHCKSKCCGIEMEQDNTSPRHKPTEMQERV